MWPRRSRAALPEVAVEMRAVDGAVARDVAERLDATPLPDDAAVFLSCGGNDALGRIQLLDPGQQMAFPEAMVVLRTVREAFRAEYAPLLARLAGRRVMVCTIYNPNFTGTEASFQEPAEGALSAFNDVIQSEALAQGFDVLDLRRIFTDPADYANPIEPSAMGGAKIAAAVAAWVRR